MEKYLVGRVVRHDMSRQFDYPTSLLWRAVVGCPLSAAKGICTTHRCHVIDHLSYVRTIRNLLN